MLPVDALLKSGMSQETLLTQPALYMTNYTVARLIFLNDLYKMILPVHGSILEFGVRWGGDLAWFANLRTNYEPFSFRPIVGFDTWAGFPKVDACDGDHEVGELGTPENYEQHLSEVLSWHEASLYPQGKFYGLIKGDVAETLPEFFKVQPQTIVALAYFDIDLHAPTKAALEGIAPYLTKGSVLAFDELNYADWPGETIALRETLGLARFALKRMPYSRSMSYCVVE